MDKKEKARLRSKEWRKNNKEKHAAYNKEYRDNNSQYYTDKATAHNRKTKRGFTPELYEQRLIDQNYACAICGKHVSESKTALAADHDHITGKPRGLLCTQCNVMLGFAKDDPSILAKAILYLEQYK